MNEMIATQKLCKSYDRGLTQALTDISFRIAQGEIVALMGPSGSGKSTLLNILGTIDFPSSGQVWIEDNDWYELRPHHRFRSTKLGFIFQFHHLLPHLTIIENLEVSMQALKVSKQEKREKAKAILEMMGIGHKQQAYPSMISGGERQRAAVGRALANEPTLILADEPTGSIDSKTGEEVMNHLIEYCTQNSATMILATHNSQLTPKVTRILYLKDGQIES